MKRLVLGLLVAMTLIVAGVFDVAAQEVPPGLVDFCADQAVGSTVLDRVTEIEWTCTANGPAVVSNRFEVVESDQFEVVTEPATVTVTEVDRRWTPVGKFSTPIIADDEQWELVTGTHFAVTTVNGRYEAIPSSPVGVVDGVDHGWCGATQIVCPPHGLMVRVEPPTEFFYCAKAYMDISWRVWMVNECGHPVTYKFSTHYNNVTRNDEELMRDYLMLSGGLTEKVETAESELGLFVTVAETGTAELTYWDVIARRLVTVLYGYSCWDCLANTTGQGGLAPLPLVNISTVGPQTEPTGLSVFPGRVFQMPRPEGENVGYSLSFEVEVVDEAVVFTGQYLVPKRNAEG